MTEEQKAWFDKEASKINYYSDDPLYEAGWLDGAEQAIKRFSSIQWNKYPDKEPTKNGSYLAIHKKEGLILAEYHGGFGLDGLVVSHWAEVNIPNQ